MDILSDLFKNNVLLISGGAWLVAQVIKIIATLIAEKRFVAERIFGDGGMPSAHSATVTCLATLIGYTMGFSSPLFAIAAILAIIVMNDATGVRREAGKHAASIKELAGAVNSLFVEKRAEIKTEKLKLLVGHTPLQVLFGAILGIGIGVASIFIFGLKYGGI